jgi:hypothetical protein
LEQQRNIRITTSYNLGVGALRVGEIEEANALANGGGRRATRQGIIAESSIVWATNTLYPDIRRAVLALKRVTKRRSQSALYVR